MKLGLGLLLGAGLGITSAVANTIDINMTPAPGTQVQHMWPGLSFYVDDYQFMDTVSAAGESGYQPTLNLSGVTGISVTWNAPAGDMFVVNPPPAGIDLTLAFDLQYAGNASLGSVSGSSISVNTVYGTSPLVGSIGTMPVPPNMTIEALASMNSSSAPFAFTSITITADFNGASGTLTGYNGGDPSEFFGVYFGIRTRSGIPYTGPSDPGQLFFIEPLPSGNVPDKSPTISLAAISALGLLFLKRQMVTA